jgi:hypothetical protein
VMFQAYIEANRLLSVFHHTIVTTDTSEEAEAAYRGFRKELKKIYPKIKFDLRVPNLYSAFLNSRVHIPARQQGKSNRFSFTGWTRPGSEPSVEVKPVEDFEVNLSEPLVGWKTWIVDTRAGVLVTRGVGRFDWHSGVAAEAKCNAACGEAVPSEGHTCGIYASSERQPALAFYNSSCLNVFGEVYGWGRYIRGDQGWRSQFAYPKNFSIQPEQVELIDTLRKFRVPISVLQSEKIYEPAEDGYENFESMQREALENEYRGNQEDRDQ